MPNYIVPRVAYASKYNDLPLVTGGMEGFALALLQSRERDIPGEAEEPMTFAVGPGEGGRTLFGKNQQQLFLAGGRDQPNMVLHVDDDTGNVTKCTVRLLPDQLLIDRDYHVYAFNGHWQHGAGDDKALGLQCMYRRVRESRSRIGSVLTLELCTKASTAGTLLQDASREALDDVRQGLTFSRGMHPSYMPEDTPEREDVFTRLHQVHRINPNVLESLYYLYNFADNHEALAYRDALFATLDKVRSATA